MNKAYEQFLRDNPHPCFLPDWDTPEDAFAVLVVVDLTGEPPTLNVVWRYEFNSIHAIGGFWDFIVRLESAWPFMARVVERRGPEALTSMLRRHGAPLPAPTPFSSERSD